MQAPLIAVIDDDAPTREFLDEVLRSVGYRTLLWGQGKDAHLLIRREKPDLIILDMWMEDREAGRTVLGLMGLDPSTRRIPVIICSAHVGVADGPPREFHDRGYVILPKPFGTDDLLGKIRGLLGQAGAKV